MIYILIFLCILIGCLTIEVLINAADEKTPEETLTESPNWWNRSSIEVIKELLKADNKTWTTWAIVAVYLIKVVARLLLVFTGFGAVASYIPY